MNKKGFTLIELLAVIIILGILMIIAIPSVTKYISDSRKSAYVDTVRQVINGTRNYVNSGKEGLYDQTVTYYIDARCIETENALKSPYGEFVKAYVAVTYNGQGYDYYWTSVDESGQGFKGLIKLDKLDSDLIESDLKPDDISLLRGIDGRTNVQVIDFENGCIKGNATAATSYVSSSGEDLGAVLYPSGKEDDTLTIGDVVRVGDQEFYFLKYDDDGNKVLFSRYNLKVGEIYEVVDNSFVTIRYYSSSDYGYGLQSPEAYGIYQGDTIGYGTVSFSSSQYWGSQSYPAYVYNENSNIAQYVNNYQEYLEDLGVEVVEARIPSKEEIMLFVYNDYLSLIDNSSFWTGTLSTYSNSNIYAILTNSRNGSAYYSSSNFAGVRPLIVIK